MESTIQYPVSEIFTSIQGEGIHLGRVTTFIRLEGCNLRCVWCDTADKAFDIKDEHFMSVEEILSKVESDFVVITGGEPTIYDLLPLAKALHEMECIVAIETNGTNLIPLETDQYIDWVTCSPKPPLYELKCDADELKYVCDGNLHASHISKLKQYDSMIWIQPESHKPESIAKAIAMVRANPWLRMGIQLHKVLGVE